jgi:hypothetical protein
VGGVICNQQAAVKAVKPATALFGYCLSINNVLALASFLPEAKNVAWKKSLKWSFHLQGVC